MSESTDVSTSPCPAKGSMPVWFMAGILGVFLGGAGGVALAMYGYDYRIKEREKRDLAAMGIDPAAPPGPGGAGMGAPGGGMMGAGMMGPPGGGGPGGGMMGPPGMGGGGPGGGGPSGKRDLTALVGKVELLSRPNIQLTLDAEQQSKFAAALAELRSAEKLTDEDAEKRLETLEAILTPEQKEALDAVALPRRGGGGGGPGGGMMGGGPGGPGGGGPGADPDANPFAQEANEQRLSDLLSRLQPAAAENKEPAAENKEPAAENKEPAAENKEPAAE